MSRLRCERCLRPHGHCLCPLIPSLPSDTRVLLLQHPDEQRHALNTARLAALGLQNVQLEVGETFADLALWLAQPGFRPCLLFPGEQAQPLVAAAAEDVPLLLVVPDGTWRKARKLLYLNPELQQLPRVTLAEGKPSRYRLRKAPSGEALSTLEAIVVALETVEQGDFSALLDPFEALIEGQIQAMGEQTYRRNHLKTT